MSWLTEPFDSTQKQKEELSYYSNPGLIIFEFCFIDTYNNSVKFFLSFSLNLSTFNKLSKHFYTKERETLINF